MNTHNTKDRLINRNETQENHRQQISGDNRMIKSLCLFFLIHSTLHVGGYQPMSRKMLKGDSLIYPTRVVQTHLMKA